jgi:hypothetical protein
MLKEAGNQPNNDEIFEIYRAASESEYGQKLRVSERWNHYKPDGMEFGEWQKILGYDVNNMDHMRLTDFITVGFVDLQNKIYPEKGFNQEEIKLLRMVAVLHDMPEAISGDKRYDLKTEADEEIELKNMSLILGSFSVRIDDEMTKQIIDVLKNKTSKLGIVFSAIERIGYFKTGIKAWLKSENPKFDQKIADGL